MLNAFPTSLLVFSGDSLGGFMMSLSAGKRKPTTWTLGRFTGISAFAAFSNPQRPAVPPFAARTPAAQSCGVFPHGLGGTQVVSVSASSDPALAANQPVLTSIPVPDARGPTRPATVAVNPPLPKVIVSPSSHTLPMPSKRDVLASYLLHYDEHESTILLTGFTLGVFPSLI